MPTVLDVLKEVAKSKNLITYKELAHKLNISSNFTPWNQHPFCDIFDQLDQEDARMSRPMITSLAVNSKKTGPGGGYFRALELYTGIKSLNTESKLINWASQVKAVYEYDWSKT